MASQRAIFLRQFLAAGVGAAFFVLCRFVFQFSWLLSLVLTAAGYAAGLLAFPTPKSDREAMDAAVAAARTQVGQIRQHASRILSLDAKKKIARVCQLLADILDYFNDRPAELRELRSFSAGYLDRAVRAAASYSRIVLEPARKGDAPSGIQGEMQQAEALLDTVIATLEEHLERLYKNQVSELKHDLASLRKAPRSGEAGDDAP